MPGIKKEMYPFEDEMDMADMPMDEEMPAAEEEEAPAVDLEAVSDEDLMKEAEKRGLIEPEEAIGEMPEEPMPEEM